MHIEQKRQQSGMCSIFPTLFRWLFLSFELFVAPKKWQKAKKKSARLNVGNLPDFLHKQIHQIKYHEHVSYTYFERLYRITLYL